MDFSVLADRDCLVAFAAVVLCPDRGVEAEEMGCDYGGIAHLTAKGAAGRTGLSQGAVGRALQPLEEAGLIIGDGDGDAWRTSAGIFAGGGDNAPPERGQGIVAETAGAGTEMVGAEVYVGGRRVPRLKKSAATTVHTARVPPAPVRDRLRGVRQPRRRQRLGLRRGRRRVRSGPAQVAAEEKAKVVNAYDFGDDWRHDIVVEKITPALPGVAYPRCTGGRGWASEDDSGGIWARNEAVAAAEMVMPFTPTSPSLRGRRRSSG